VIDEVVTPRGSDARVWLQRNRELGIRPSTKARSTRSLSERSNRKRPEAWRESGRRLFKPQTVLLP